MRCWAFTILLICAGSTRADDWPQWLGPKRDGVWRETGIIEKFPESGLKVKWRVPVHAGYSGPAVRRGTNLPDGPQGGHEQRPRPFSTRRDSRKRTRALFKRSRWKSHLAARVRLPLQRELPVRPARDASRSRRQSVHAGHGGKSVLLQCGRWEGALVARVQKRFRDRHAAVGLFGAPAHRWRQTDLFGRRQPTVSR